MRTLIISDTHFGAWTGNAVLSRPEALERLAPRLADIDELVHLGDLFDWLFGTVDGAMAEADAFFELVREHLQGRRFVLVPGNHDHHLIRRDEETAHELELATGRPRRELQTALAERAWLRQFLERRLEGVEIVIAYPNYQVGDVLCTHGHYLDVEVHHQGSLGDRALSWILWSTVTAGQPSRPRTTADYESVITLLTEILYATAQVPRGTVAQRGLYRQIKRAEGVLHAATRPAAGVRHLISRAEDRLERRWGGRHRRLAGARERRTTAPDYSLALADEAQRSMRSEGPSGRGRLRYGISRVVRPSDPPDLALRAFVEVVRELGWADGVQKVVFAHTHQPVADVRLDGLRLWNTGSWIYEPDLGSHEAYTSYLRWAWPGTGVLIDTEPDGTGVRSAVTAVEMLADHNPLNRAAGADPPTRPAFQRPY